MLRFVFSILLLLVLPQALSAQIAPDRVCKNVIGVFPITLRQFGEDEPAEQPPRFELRSCPSGNVQVYGYERDAKQPTFSFDTLDKYVSLFDSFNVLVMQGLGGSSDHVYVFTFDLGKPKLALQTAVNGNVKVYLDALGKNVVVEVPPVQYPDSAGVFPPTPPPDVYQFPLLH